MREDPDNHGRLFDGGDDLQLAAAVRAMLDVETLLSGPGIELYHAKINGEILEPDEIAARAAAGNPACEATLRR